MATDHHLLAARHRHGRELIQLHLVVLPEIERPRQQGRGSSLALLVPFAIARHLAGAMIDHRPVGETISQHLVAEMTDGLMLLRPVDADTPTIALLRASSMTKPKEEAGRMILLP